MSTLGEPQQPIYVALAKIVQRLIADPRGWRVDALREELGIAPSTYRKYRKILREQFDFLRDENGQTLVEDVADGDARYLRLRSIDEAEERERIPQIIALYMARSMMGFLTQTDLFRRADEFHRMLLGRAKGLSFPHHHFRDLDRMIYAAPFAPKNYGGKNAIIENVLHGIFYRRKLRIVYRVPGEDAREHTLDPLTLLLWKSGLYLVGRGDKYPDPAIYAIDRIEKVERLREKFVYPKDYSPKKLLDGSFGIFREQGKSHHVELVFANDPALHVYLRERLWHPTQRFLDMPDGRLKMTFTVNSLVEVDPWVRGFGEKVVRQTPIRNCVERCEK